MNTILLITTTILTFSGFFIAFYGVLSQSMIDAETKIGMQKGIDSFSDEGAEYFARRYEKWRAGHFFLSNNALILGLLLVIIASVLNILKNPWWTSIVIIIVGYFLYLTLAKIIGWKLQIISFFLALFSLCYSIYLIL